MQLRKFVGHTDGILISKPGSQDWSALAGEDIVALAHDSQNPSLILAGSYGRGLFKSSDSGANWSHVELDVEYIRTIAFSSCEPGTVYLGIEPAELFRSRDSGETWECLHIRRLPEAADWSLPYSPRSGALRTIALHPTNPLIIYGGVEQGGVIKSTDGGKNWDLASNGLKLPMDDMVESFVIDLHEPDTIFALCSEGGLLRSNIQDVRWESVSCEVSVQCLEFVEQT